MLMEIHCHTAEESSCSTVPAVDLVRAVAARGLDGMVLTDHHLLWSGEDLRRLHRDSGVSENFIVLGAQEVTTGQGNDILVFGARRSIPFGTGLRELRRDWPDAALVWAHPFRFGRTPGDGDLEAYDAVEAVNSNQMVSENLRALAACRRLGVRALAGTDTHGASYAGLFPTRFHGPVATIGDLAELIRSGAFSPYLDDVPEPEDPLPPEPAGTLDRMLCRAAGVFCDHVLRAKCEDLAAFLREETGREAGRDDVLIRRALGFVAAAADAARGEGAHGRARMFLTLAEKTVVAARLRSPEEQGRNPGAAG